MRKVTVALLLTCMLALPAMSVGEPAQKNQAVKTFWQKFKTAVIGGDKATVATMSKFPIEMSYGIASIKNRAQLIQRWREVFNKQTNAAQCFAKKEPEMEQGNPKRFSVTCPNEAGDEVVVYSFERTQTGWKFASLDNINE